ncbi:alkaline phosphatase family protein [Pseudalkalibacillus caeni]|uniref:Alkaline phosphatase family protein n=1 Tax=Exobacillus caeni TaxID=2574798 RepID=A0A5R9F6J3_9BACL|nr:alkaline phosphatase family protein [Pseudalkalibacillus caeni]TLS36104.1 alkaline phosphatase family protein [Pseudalkalibacillus caeni]
MKWVISIAIIVILFFLFRYLLGTQGLRKPPRAEPGSSKPVVVLVVDSLMDKPLQKLIKSGQVPAFEFFYKNANYYQPEMVASYPSMSVSMDSTLLTGTYPDQHKIPALNWYNVDQKKVINYGTSSKEVLTVGLKQVLEDSIYHLSNQHLSDNVTTIHEKLHSEGNQSASLNALVYRGSETQTLFNPRITSLFNLLPEKKTVSGPGYLSFGKLSYYNAENKKNAGIFKDLGFNNTFTAQELKYLIENKTLPSYTIAYFPDNDHTIHKNGPSDVKGIKQTDQALQTVLNAFTSSEEALESVTWIIMGDGGQTPIGSDKKEALIPLRPLLSQYQITKTGEKVKQDDEIVLAVNERMAYIYSLDENIPLNEIADTVLGDSRIDFAAYKENNFIRVKKNGHNQSLLFGHKGKFKDEYGQQWTIEGSLNVLDLTTDSENNVTYGRYPDALARLYGAINSHPGRFLAIDAKPGHEFVDEKSPTHVGGASHGALFKDESVAPMIIVGTELKPKTNRHVDLKEFLLKILLEKTD